MTNKRENDGYCFIDGKIRLPHILSALRNIPYNLLPPTLKKAEDFLKSLKINPYPSFPPELKKIDKDLSDSSKKQTQLYKKLGKENIFEGTIPFIHEYSKCDYGQEPIEMAKDLNIGDLYRALEDSFYSASYTFKTLEAFLNEKGKDLIDDKYIEYSKHDPKRIERSDNEFTKMGSQIYRNHFNDFDTQEVLDAKKEYEENKEDEKTIGRTFGYDSEEYKDVYSKGHKIGKRMNELRKQAKIDFKKAVHNYWIDDWYDKNAWDFDEEERKELKNPYLEKEK